MGCGLSKEEEEHQSYEKNRMATNDLIEKISQRSYKRNAIFVDEVERELQKHGLPRPKRAVLIHHIRAADIHWDMYNGYRVFETRPTGGLPEGWSGEPSEDRRRLGEVWVSERFKKDQAFVCLGFDVLISLILRNF